MANSDKPFGARLIGHVNGSAFNAQIRRYAVPATDSDALFVGDFVVSGGAMDTDGVPTCAVASPGGDLRFAGLPEPVGRAYLFKHPRSRLYRHLYPDRNTRL